MCMYLRVAKDHWVNYLTFKKRRHKDLNEETVTNMSVVFDPQPIFLKYSYFYSLYKYKLDYT